jgi:glycosyltransferase involved in cell wall biosynthesis
MKIVVNARFLTQQVTGVQRFAIEISKILHQLNPEIVFVSPANIIDGDLAKQLNVIIIGKARGTVWEQTDLRKYLIADGKPLLINFCNTGVLYYKRQIVTIHDMSYKVNPKWFSRRFYTWYNFLIPHIAKNSLKILTVSKSSKKDIITYLNIADERIKVIYNSSNLNTNNNFERTEKERYLLSISSLDPRKNLDNTIKAFKGLNSGIKLIIVGLKSNNFGAALNKNLLDSNIVIKGYVSDYELSTLIKHAEAFVYVSFYEGFGLPPIEAMSLGCPVIVSNIQALREVCGDAALYADPYLVDDIKQKIINLLANNSLREKLIIAGKENIKKFDWFTSANEVLKIADEII